MSWPLRNARLVFALSVCVAAIGLPEDMDAAPLNTFSAMAKERYVLSVYLEGEEIPSVDVELGLGHGYGVTAQSDRASPEAARAFVHPGVLHNRAEIDFVKGRIHAGKEPWKSVWDALTQHRFAQLSWKPKPREHVARGAYNNPDIGATDLMKDSVAAYTHALRWALSDEKAHAEKAIEILNAYSSTLKSVREHDARLLVGMTGIHFVNAAELIRHSDAGWAQADQRQFGRLLLKVLYPVIVDFYPTANGNWDASMIQTMMAMGVFLNNREIFDRGVNYYLKGKGNGAITHYLDDFGQCQESGRDQAHTPMINSPARTKKSV